MNDEAWKSISVGEQSKTGTFSWPILQDRGWGGKGTCTFRPSHPPLGSSTGYVLSHVHLKWARNVCLKIAKYACNLTSSVWASWSWTSKYLHKRAEVRVSVLVCAVNDSIVPAMDVMKRQLVGIPEKTHRHLTFDQFKQPRRWFKFCILL